MSRQIIRSYNPIEARVYKDALKVVKPQEQDWLRKAVYWVAIKFGIVQTSSIPETSLSYVEIVLDEGDLTKTFYNHIDMVYNRTGKRPDLIIASPEVAFGIKKEAWKSGPIYTAMPSQLNPQFLGMKLLVLPWVEGFVLLDSSEIR